MDAGNVRAILLSALLHAAVAVFLLWGLPRLGTPLPEPPGLPVEIVILERPEPEVAEEPAATPTPEPEPPADAPAPEPEPEPAELDEPEPEPEIAEEPVSEEPVAEPEVVETPESVPEPDVAEAPEPELTAEPAPEPETAETPQPEPQPTEPAEPEPADITAAVPSVIPPRRPESVTPEEQTAVQTPPDPAPEEPAQAERAASPAPPDGAPLTPQGLLANLAALRDEDARAKANPELWEIIRTVRAQIARCWQLSPAEARNPRLSVDIAVAFDRNGRLLNTEVQQIGRMVVDEEFKAFATGAHRALKACSPFDLPAEKYDIWRDFTLRFVPRRPS